LYDFQDDPVAQLLVELLKNDSLSKYEKEKRTYAERCIITAARLIAPMVETTISKGYDWITEAIRNSKHSALAHALDVTICNILAIKINILFVFIHQFIRNTTVQISKAVALMKQGEIEQAIDIFKTFEKNDSKFLPAAANNLSFIYFLVNSQAHP
jgi:intraflagellar transport protein 88